MGKILFKFITYLTIFSYSPVKAETVTKNDVQLRDDVIFILLYPSIQQELKKQYGEIKQNMCGEITQIKQLPIGSYIFNVTVQVTTFEGANGPIYLFGYGLIITVVRVERRTRGPQFRQLNCSPATCYKHVSSWLGL
ncbi:DUF3888 domain-containing protein [Bacillus sp. JJ1764]|uniref:DUF3888 domain-containing protein n=1 Tax=Bacillus sp. JJ1764 TaxID=3122964 RepID=UPI002FFF523E